MASPAEAALYRAGQAALVGLALRDLRTWWSALDTGDAKGARAALQRFLPELLAVFGPMAAVVAVDYFDGLRAQAGVTRPFRSAMASGPPVEQLLRVAGWSAAPLFGKAPDPGAALSRVEGATQRLVQAAGRDTLIDNAARDGARWARVPTGDETCAWCLILASRGAAYSSRESAGGADAWHDDCDCQPTPSWDDDDLPYDPGPLYQQYLDARYRAGSGRIEDIAAQMRADLGIH